MRIDCSKTLNYVAERNRMCNTLEKQKGNSIAKCKVCPLHIENYECSMIWGITQNHIDIVQKWSDEHPRETMAEHFFKIFPNAPKSESGTPIICPKDIGWTDYCFIDIEREKRCIKCWNMPYIEK